MANADNNESVKGIHKEHHYDDDDDEKRGISNEWKK